MERRWIDAYAALLAAFPEMADELKARLTAEAFRAVEQEAHQARRRDARARHDQRIWRTT